MSSIQLEFHQQVAIIRLNRPDKLNAFTREMALLLQEKLDLCEKHAEVRAVMITGNGKGFSAGQDLAEVIDPDGAGMERILSEQYNPIVQQIRALQKPVLASVNGVAAGAGANIALCCDVVIAGSSASFIQAFSRIGLIPDSGGTFILPRLIGFQKASALMMLGDKIPSHEALSMGMIYKRVEDEVLYQESLATSVTLAGLPTMALAYIKQALNSSMHSTLDQQLNLEDRLQQLAAKTNDFKEGVTAFMQKRPAHFKGN